jgi:hypothetical protein
MTKSRLKVSPADMNSYLNYLEASELDNRQFKIDTVTKSPK